MANKQTGINALKYFMQENFWFSGLKKSGVFPKDMKFNDFEGQAKIICNRLGLESIYDYGKEEIHCHISYVDPNCPAGMADGRPSWVNEKGELKTIPFFETIFPNQLHITNHVKEDLRGNA